jgi:hypothetical protein
MRKSNLIISAAILSLASVSAQAAILYSASVVRTEDGDATPGAPAYSSSAGTTGHILFDDAFINRPGSNSALNLTNVSVGLIQSGNAAATNVKIYLAPMLDNTAVNATGNDPDNTSSDAVPDVGSPILLGTVPLPANPNAVAENVILSAATNTDLQGYTGYAGKLGFYVGVEFETDDTTHGWAIAKTNTLTVPFPSVYQTYDYNTNSGTTLGYNLDVAWDYTNTSSFEEFAGLPASDAAGPITTTLWTEVQGSIIPEPTTASLLIAGSALLLRRKR